MKQLKKKGILVVSFGTTYKETRKKTIEAIEKEFSKHFEEYNIRRGFTSQFIIRKLKERDGIAIDSVKDALKKMYEDGIEEIVVQPTHVIDGYENNGMLQVIDEFRDKFQKISVGAPLLSAEEDYYQLARALKAEMDECEALKAENERNTVVLWLGHGTAHQANASYFQLQSVFEACGYFNYLIGTVEGAPDFMDVLKKIKQRDVKRIILVPLLIVAGDHACNDIGGEKGSWRELLEQQGYETIPVLKGLGEYKGVRQILLEHAKRAEFALLHREIPYSKY